MEQFSYAKQGSMSKLAAVFLMAIIFSTIGIGVGTQLSAALYYPMVGLELILLLVMVFSRKAQKVGYPLMYSFMFVSGITLSFVIQAYVATIGASEVLKAFGLAVVAFTGTALYALRTKEDFRFLGGFLFVGVFFLIGAGIISIFFPFSNGLSMGVSIAGIAIFVGYTLYDFNRIAREGFTDAEIPMIVVNIYLDFVNLFLYILRFIRDLTRS